MHNNLAVQSDRRPVGYSATLVTVTDSTGREITTFRSPRKLGKALVSSALVVLNGDVFYVGKRAVIS
jgi:hypothetical protein